MKSASSTSIFWLLVAIDGSSRHPYLSTVDALSTPMPEIMPRQFIDITNPIDTTAENKLPASFVRDWPTWVLDSKGVLSKIPDDNGFVQPASIDELWHPVDLIKPELRLALGFHVRGGVIRHVMPAVDLCYPNGTHRNRGMCSLPRAYGWIDFTNSIDEWQNYRLLLAKKKKKKSTSEESNTEEKWDEFGRSSPGVISKAIERALICLAESAPAEMGEGSHFLNIPLLTEDGDSMEATECPKNGFELRVTMNDDDYYLDDEQAPGVLQVVVSASMAGSKSEFLPDAYKPLFSDESYRNPLYAKYKERQQNK